MKTWYFSECPYPTLPDADEYDSIRVSLPSSYYDPTEGARLYSMYLDLWQAADDLGLNVMTNEHHQTATCLVPAVPIIAGILARTTKNARILILGNPIANRRDPVRVAEEMAMIDNISNGRLEVGFVRGVPFEVLPANSKPVGMSDRMWEAHDLILKAWTTVDGPFSWEGSWNYRYVNVWPRTYQQPHPPIWITGTSVSSAPRIARAGHTLAAFVSGYGATKRLYDAYRQAWAEAHGKAGVPADRLAYGVQVYVADTVEAAHAAAIKMRWYFDANKVPRHLGSPPGYSPPEGVVASRTAAAPIPHARQAKGKSPEWMIENGVLMAGTPDMVVEQIKRFYDHVGGFGHLLMMGHAGGLSRSETVRSLELYAQHVAPAIAQLGSAAMPVGVGALS
jgi:alkanesulfonate monooxygenase SsuD/methylene tetrahydromethanopterin reductase-like flavin-dependent oxidoreductase (luciferase family)